MRTIYNVYVEMQDQAQCDRMKKLCVNNNLPIWEFESDPNLAFELFIFSKNFKYSGSEFLVGCDIENKNQVTEDEFIKLLKQ